MLAMFDELFSISTYLFHNDLIPSFFTELVFAPAGSEAIGPGGCSLSRGRQTCHSDIRSHVHRLGEEQESNVIEQVCWEKTEFNIKRTYIYRTKLLR